MLNRTAKAGDGAVGIETRVRPRAGGRGIRGLVGLAVAVGAALIAVPSASAITFTFAHHPMTPPTDPSAACTMQKQRWAERTASAGVGTAPDAGADLNADMVNDLWVGQPFCDVGANTEQGRVYLLSGKEFETNTTKVIRMIDSPAPAAKQRFGFFISVLGDVNGDGTPDIAIGTDPQDGTPGKAWVFSGATGAVLYQLVSPAPQNGDRFGSRIGRAGDVNGDGVPDIIVGASNENVGPNAHQGQAYIFSGKDGAFIRTLDTPDPIANANFGLAVQSPGDVNGDHIPDQVVDAANFPGGLPSQGRMYVFDGASATGKLMSRIDDPTPQPLAFFGFQDVTPLSPGDLNGDGKAEIYGNGFLQTDTLPNSGEAWVFDGNSVANGVPVVLRTLHDPTPEPGGQFGWSMSKTDYNHDGVNDLYVGQSPHVAAFPLNQNGGTYVFDGTNGSPLQSLEMPTKCRQNGAPGDNGPALGWTVSTPGDLNGDGQADYVAGAPFFNRGTNIDEGVLLAFMSGEVDNPDLAC